MPHSNVFAKSIANAHHIGGDRRHAQHQMVKDQ
jgi:hypothetical protein